MDNTSTDTLASLPSFRVDPEQDWGPSDFDVRHTLSGGLTYAFHKWSADAIFAARYALPVNVVTRATVFGVSNALRPDVVPTRTATLCIRARSNATRFAGSR